MLICSLTVMKYIYTYNLTTTVNVRQMYTTCYMHIRCLCFCYTSRYNIIYIITHSINRNNIHITHVLVYLVFNSSTQCKSHSNGSFPRAGYTSLFSVRFYNQMNLLSLLDGQISRIIWTYLFEWQYLCDNLYKRIFSSVFDVHQDV